MSDNTKYRWDDMYGWIEDDTYDEDSMTNEGNTICKHEYVLYHGLINTFEYCKFCDVKKKKESIENNED